MHHRVGEVREQIVVCVQSEQGRFEAERLARGEISDGVCTIDRLCFFFALKHFHSILDATRFI